jgi:hypothetical protein
MPHLRDAGEGSSSVLDNHWSERLGARGREGLSKRWRHLAYYTLRYEVPLFFLVALKSTSRLRAFVQNWAQPLAGSRARWLRLSFLAGGKRPRRKRASGNLQRHFGSVQRGTAASKAVKCPPQ